MSNEGFNAICWRSLLFGIFIIKKCVVFSLTSFDTLKYHCVIKTVEMFNFLPLINSSVTIGLIFLLLIIYQQSYHQKVLALYVSSLGCILQ